MPRRLAILFLALLVTTFAATQTSAPAGASAKKPVTKKKAATAGQAANPGATSGAAPAGAPGTVGPNTPVMFVSGLCALQGANVPAIAVPPRPGMPPGTCMRGVTRSQFEMMVTGLGPQGAQAEKTQLAEYYIRGLLIENEARKLKLEQDPQVAEIIWMSRIAALSEALHRHLQKQFSNISEADVAAYYNAHKNEFDEATIRRIVIPKPQQKATVVKPGDAKSDAKGDAKTAAAAPDSPSAAKPAVAAEVPYSQQLAARKTYSDKLLERAKAGEAFDKLQKDAFVVAGLQMTAPDTEAVAIHREDLPPAHAEKVFALQAGQYTTLIEEPSAYIFYKLESRRTLPLADASAKIKTTLRNQKEDEAIQQVFRTGKPNLNPAYFAMPKGAAAEATPDAPEAAQPQAQPEEPKHEHEGMDSQAAPQAPTATSPPAQTAPAQTAPPQSEPPKQEPPK